MRAYLPGEKVLATELQAAIERKREGYHGYEYIGDDFVKTMKRRDNAIIADHYMQLVQDTPRNRRKRNLK